MERNSNILPMLHRVDLSITQDFYVNIAGKRNSFQFRADILNFTNMVNRDWGVSQRATATIFWLYHQLQVWLIISLLFTLWLYKQIMKEKDF